MKSAVIVGYSVPENFVIHFEVYIRDDETTEYKVNKFDAYYEAQDFYFRARAENRSCHMKRVLTFSEMMAIR